MRSRGYTYVLRPEHPRAGRSGYVKRANLVMEKTLGRLLRKDEMVHHKNEDKSDDSPSNLEVMTRGQHQHLHASRQPRGKSHPRSKT